MAFALLPGRERSPYPRLPHQAVENGVAHAPWRRRHRRAPTRDAAVTESTASPAGKGIAPRLAVGAGRETGADVTTRAVAAECSARVNVAPPRAVLARLEPGTDGATAALVLSACVLIAPVVARS